MDRAYSLFEIKSIDDDLRIIEGVASTPNPDRVDDIVEPMGAEFKVPLPLLWQHRSDSPVGWVEVAKASTNGISFRAKMAKIAEAGELKNLVDKAWQAVKEKLVRGVSIGFRSLEHEYMSNGGVRFKKWEWLELSVVTIPANADATITLIKSIDREALAASGRVEHPVEPNQPRVRGPVSLIAPKKETAMTIGERIAQLEATRAAKAAQMEKVLTKSLDENRTTAPDEQEEYDTLKAEVDAIDKDLDRLRSLEKIQAATAKPIDGTTERKGIESRAPAVIVRTPVKALPGVRFARFARCIGLGKRMGRDPVMLAEQLYKNTDPDIIDVLKVAVSAGSTASGNWAADLVGAETGIFADFVEFLRPQTILGKFGVGGVPGLRQVPFRTPLISQVGGGSGYWVGQGAPKPVTAFDFNRTTLLPLKVANIAVVTMELLRDSSPSAEILIRDSLAAALRERQDIDFVDPDKTAVANISPASITNGISPITSTGNDADSIREDIRLLLAAFAADNNPPTTAVFLMPATTALGLSLMRTTLGAREFPDIGVNGGTLEGIPVITSQYMAGPTAGDYVILMNAQDVYFADDGGVDVDMSTEASLQMDNAPTNNSVTPTATSLVSLWQTNSVGFLAERTVNWMRRRDEGVQYLSAVNWGEPGS